MSNGCCDMILICYDLICCDVMSCKCIGQDIALVCM